jgi:hypothetical protein
MRRNKKQHGVEQKWEGTYTFMKYKVRQYIKGNLRWKILGGKKKLNEQKWGVCVWEINKKCVRKKMLV